MAGENENEFGKRVALTLRQGDTAHVKVDALLDLLVRKGVIDQKEAAEIRAMKVY